MGPGASRDSCEPALRAVYASLEHGSGHRTLPYWPKLPGALSLCSQDHKAGLPLGDTAICWEASPLTGPHVHRCSPPARPPMWIRRIRLSRPPTPGPTSGPTPPASASTSPCSCSCSYTRPWKRSICCFFSWPGRSLPSPRHTALLHLIPAQAPPPGAHSVSSRFIDLRPVQRPFQS